MRRSLVALSLLASCTVNVPELGSGPFACDDDSDCANGYYCDSQRKQCLPNGGGGSTGQAPVAPDQLSATASSSTSIRLQWRDNSNNETFFRVERAPNSNGPFDEIRTLGSNEIQYEDTGLTPGTTYTYRVLAGNTAGTSTPSNMVTAQTVAPDAPAAPTNLTAAVASGLGVELIWTDNANNEAGFTIERRMGTGAFATLQLVGPNITSYADTSTSPSTPYSYRVKAFNSLPSGGDSAWSNIVDITTPGGGLPPNAPTNLRLVTNTGTSLTIMWDDNSTNETDCRIERDAGGSGFTYIGAVGANVNEYADGTVGLGGSYGYRVSACATGLGCSPFSNELRVVAVPTPATPTGLSGQAMWANLVRVSWIDNSNDETGFVLERSLDGTMFSVIANASADVVAYDDTSVSASSRYYYRVKAINDGGESPYTGSSAIFTPAMPTSLYVQGPATPNVGDVVAYLATDNNGQDVSAFATWSVSPAQRGALSAQSFSAATMGSGIVSASLGPVFNSYPITVNSAVRLPQTGQGPIVSGDDGSYGAGTWWPGPRFTNAYGNPLLTGDSVVLDQLTGLMWQRDPSAGFGSCGAATPPAMSWSTALSYVACLNSYTHLGYSDWHLPSVRELVSLVNRGTNPDFYLDSGGFLNVGPATAFGYWSSTTNSGQGMQSSAWAVFFGMTGGVPGGTINSFAKMNTAIPWPVRHAATALPTAEVMRTGQISCYDAQGIAVPCSNTGQDGDVLAGRPLVRITERFTNADGTALSASSTTMRDQMTGLEWARDGFVEPMGPCAGFSLYWQQALDVVACVNSQGYLGGGWRMPNIVELYSLLDLERVTSGTGLPSTFVNPQATYWSSTSDAVDTTRAWSTDASGAILSDSKTTQTHHFLLVRGP